MFQISHDSDSDEAFEFDHNFMPDLKKTGHRSDNNDCSSASTHQQNLPLPSINLSSGNDQSFRFPAVSSDDLSRIPPRTLESLDWPKEQQTNRPPLAPKNGFHNNLYLSDDGNFFNEISRSSNVANRLLHNPFDQSSNPEVSTRKLKKTVTRRFPGPAGVLPPRRGNTSLIAPEEFLDELRNEENDRKFEDAEILSQRSLSIFEGGAWIAMLEDLASFGPTLLKSMNLASIKATGRNLRSYKVPFLAVLVHAIDASLPDAAVIFKDPTGEMNGVIHRDVWEQFSTDITVNCVLVLRNVGIMSAGTSSRKHVVNVTGKNLTALYTIKNELNIELRRICSLSADQSPYLLAEWEKVESLSSNASPQRSWKSVFSPLIQQATSSSSKGNNLAFTPNRKLPNFTVPSPSDCDTPNKSLPSPFAPMSRASTGSKVPSGATAPQQILGGQFSPLASHSRGGRVNPILTLTNKPPNIECSASNEMMRHNVKSKFAFKIAQGNRESPVVSTKSSTLSTADWPAKRSKISETSKSAPKTNTTKSNPFQVESDVQSLLDGIDTDSLFGDF